MAKKKEAVKEQIIEEINASKFVEKLEAHLLGYCTLTNVDKEELLAFLKTV